MGDLRLCAIYCVWYDSIELLPFSVRETLKVVDEVLIIYSSRSNYGHRGDYKDQISHLGTLIQWEPEPLAKPAINELNKRNFGLECAKEKGFTHYIMMDSDEIYKAEELLIDKQALEKFGYLNGFVHPLLTYIKEPTLCCPDHTLVCGIHKLLKGTKFILGYEYYPFAYDEAGNAHIDPTRRPNYDSGIMMSDTVMHHFSHVRKNMELKIENSTARNGLRRSTIMKDYESAAPGAYSEFYRQILKEVPNSFGIEI